MTTEGHLTIKLPDEITSDPELSARIEIDMRTFTHFISAFAVEKITHFQLVEPSGKAHAYKSEEQLEQLYREHRQMTIKFVGIS